MTASKVKSAQCTLCQDEHYILSNEKGWLRSKLCECFNCDQCQGQGKVIFEDEQGRSLVRNCVCSRLKQSLIYLNRAGIPGKFVNSTFQTYMTNPPHHQLQKRAKSRAMDFVKHFGESSQGLVFMGGPGLGKTHLVVAIIKALILEKGIPCKFVDFFQLLSDIKHGYSQDMSEQAIINPYIQTPVLVIDELAKGRGTEWELTMLDQIIASRYNAADKITLFTTNYNNVLEEKNSGKKTTSRHIDTDRLGYGEQLTRETLPDRTGLRIYSRIAEMCEFIEMEGIDQRQAKLTQSRQFPRTRK